MEIQCNNSFQLTIVRTIQTKYNSKLYKIPSLVHYFHNTFLQMNLLTLRIKLSSGCNFWSTTACLIFFSNSKSRFLGTSRDGNKSHINPIKTGKSSVTILGMLKSRRALINTLKKQTSSVQHSNQKIKAKLLKKIVQDKKAQPSLTK